MTRTPLFPRRLSPAALAVALAAGAPLAAGCRSVDRRTSTPVSSAAGANPRPASTAPKTDFHKDISVANQFNVHVELAKLHESQADFESAVAEYQKAIDVCARKGTILGGSALGPAQQALAHRRMAAAFDRMGRFTQGESHRSDAMKLAPDDPKLWNDAGYSYYVQGRWADAERALKTADKMDPNNPRVLTNLGLVLAAQGKTGSALTALSRANGPAVGHANLGFLLAATGKTAEARSHYAEALTIQPELTAAREALARLDAAAVAGPNALASAGGTTRPRTDTGSPVLPVLPPAVQATGPADPQITPTSGTARAR